MSGNPILISFRIFNYANDKMMILSQQNVIVTPLAIKEKPHKFNISQQQNHLYSKLPLFNLCFKFGYCSVSGMEKKGTELFRNAPILNVFEEDVDSIFSVFKIPTFMGGMSDIGNNDFTLENANNAEFRSEIASKHVHTDRLIEIVDQTKSYVDYFLTLTKLKAVTNLNSFQKVALAEHLNNKLQWIFDSEPHFLMVKETLMALNRLYQEQQDVNGADNSAALLNNCKLTCKTLIKNFTNMEDWPTINLTLTFLVEIQETFKGTDDFILSLLLMINKNDSFIVEVCKFLFKVVPNEQPVGHILRLLLFIIDSKGHYQTAALLSKKEMLKVLKLILQMHHSDGKIVEIVLRLFSILLQYVEPQEVLSLIKIKAISSIYANFESELRPLHSAVILFFKSLVLHKKINFGASDKSFTRDDATHVVAVINKHLSLAYEITDKSVDIPRKIGVFVADLVWILNVLNTLVQKMKAHKEILADNANADLISNIVVVVLKSAAELFSRAGNPGKVFENKYSVTRIVYLLVQNYSIRGRRPSPDLVHRYLKLPELKPESIVIEQLVPSNLRIDSKNYEKAIERAKSKVAHYTQFYQKIKKV